MTSPSPAPLTEAEETDLTCLTCSHSMALHNPLGICRQLLVRTPRDRTAFACCCVTEETAELLSKAFKVAPELRIARSNPLSLPASKETPMPAEPTTTETGHAVNVAAGTFGGEPWLYLECGCGWRIGFDTVCDPRELSRAAAVHETVDA